MTGPERTGTCRLALADGAIFRGRAFGACERARIAPAEVVFNTAMCGYQEALTDPSYSGQTLVMTAPLIGVYGANSEDVESARVQVSGFVVRDLIRRTSNHRATTTLDGYLRDNGILGLCGVDTRALTRRLRSAGAMSGVLTNDEDASDAELVRMARSAPSMAGQNLASLASCSSRQTFGETLGSWTLPDLVKGRHTVLAIDCGAKRNILRHLVSRGCAVTLTPYDTPAPEIRNAFLEGEFDGLFISNGPGDPAAVAQTIETLRDLMSGPAEEMIPTFGICLGCQLLARAAGAETYKLKFGHRGVNQPVLNTVRGRVEITSQNHGFAVDAASLEAIGAEVTHVHLNDGTLAGFRLRDRPVFAVQHHPEASPGPHDAGYLFDAFVRMMASGRLDLAAAAGGARRPE